MVRLGTIRYGLLFVWVVSSWYWFYLSECLVVMLVLSWSWLYGSASLVVVPVSPWRYFCCGSGFYVVLNL